MTPSATTTAPTGTSPRRAARPASTIASRIHASSRCRVPHFRAFPRRFPHDGHRVSLARLHHATRRRTLGSSLRAPSHADGPERSGANAGNRVASIAASPHAAPGFRLRPFGPAATSFNSTRPGRTDGTLQVPRLCLHAGQTRRAYRLLHERQRAGARGAARRARQGQSLRRRTGDDLRLTGAVRTRSEPGRVPGRLLGTRRSRWRTSPSSSGSTS